MNKATELEILRDAVRRLGTDSYCGPWLDSVLQEVERDMRCDFIPAATMGDTAKQCAELVKVAEERAAELQAHAKRHADRTIKEAEAQVQPMRDRVNAMRARLAETLRTAERQLWEVA